jgi:hypothetical protein
VRCSKEADGWLSLLASNRQVAEQTVTLGLLEAQFMSDAAAALEVLESTLERVGLTKATPCGEQPLAPVTCISSRALLLPDNKGGLRDVVGNWTWGANAIKASHFYCLRDVYV